MVSCDKCGAEADLVTSTENGRLSFVCHACKHFIGYQTETYSRVVGYLRPVSQWNVGMKQQFKDRKTFKMPVEE